MKRLLILLLALIPASTFAQGVRYDNIAIRSNGLAIAAPTVNVCTGITNPLTTCTTGNASLFSDVGLTVSQSNPTIGDNLGNYGFYIAPGNYTLTISASGISPVSFAITLSPNTAAALKPAMGDAIQYVSANGNDSNDGLSQGSAKLTPAAAYGALPTCTPVKPTGGSQVVPSVTAKCGTIHLAANASGYTVSSLLDISSMFVKIVGDGKFSTTINCTAASCLEFDNSANFYGVTTSSTAGLYDVTVVGNGTASQICVLGLDATGLVMRDVRIVGCNGTSAEGLELKNDTLGYTERTDFDNLWFDDDTSNLVVNGTGGAGQDSFGHQHWAHLQFSLNNGQTAITVKGNAQLYNSFVQGVINTNPPNTSAYTATLVANTALIKGMWNLNIDNAGGGTMTATSGTTNNNFQVFGYNTGNSSSFVNRDDPMFFDVTASGAVNSPTWSLNGVSKWGVFLDGINNFSLFDFVNSKETISFTSGVGGFIATEGGSPGGFAGTDDCYADSVAHTLKCSYNNDAMLPVTRTVASGTATMTTAAITAGACGTTVTVAGTGIATTDTITYSFNASVAANPGELTLRFWPTSGNVNFEYCNPTAASVTPNAATLNWRVVR